LLENHFFAILTICFAPRKLTLLMKLLSVFLLLLCCSLSYSQRAANLFRRLDTGAGLSSNQINTIFSDSRGMIWFATVSGLNRFDGHSVRVFKNLPGDPTTIPENSIQRIYEDHLGFLWLFTTNRVFIFDPAIEKFGVDHPLFHKNIRLPIEHITSVKVGADSALWITNLYHGVYHYTPSTGQFQHLFPRSGSPGSISSSRVSDISFCTKGFPHLIHTSGLVDVVDPVSLKVVETIDLEINSLIPGHVGNFRLVIDSDNDLWVYSTVAGNGLIFANRASGQVTRFCSTSAINRLSSNMVSGVIEDRKGKIWVATDHGGINIIDKNTMKVEVLLNNPGDETSLSSNVITSIHKSQDGIIWVGTFKNGVNYYHESLFQFQLYRAHSFHESDVFANDVNCFAEDKHGNLWIGTNGRGLVYYNRANGSFHVYRHQPGNPNSISSDIIVSLCIDHKGRLWIGTYQGGLNLYNGQGFVHFKHSNDNPDMLPDNRVWQIFEDSRKRLWVGTLGGGLAMFDERANRFVIYREGDFNSVSSDFILDLMEDRQGNLWIGTSAGLNMLEASTNRFKHFLHDENNPAGLSHPSVLSLLEDARGRLWVGTRNGLNLLDPETGTFSVFREEDGLPDHNIITMLDDGTGDVWIATLNGLSNLRTDGKGQVSFRNYDLLDGLQGLEFNVNSALRTSRGEMLFGGADGFNIFIPEQIIEHQHQFNVVLTDFKVMNRSVSIGQEMNGHVILERAVGFLSRVSIRHDQNVFSIGFAALNYFHPERTRFRYKLEGFNNQWIETDSRNRVATYTNLNPGDYIFRVQATGSDGNWGQAEAMLNIRVIPPIYASTWAFVIYFLLFLIFVILLVAVIRKREKARYQRQQEKDEVNRIRYLDALKTRFFTNVSHEFRTPLTLILTPLERMINDERDAPLKEQLKMIQRNGKRLLHLVNQLLDFRKIEVDKISLNPSHGDVAGFISDVFCSFSDLFQSKNLSYNYFSSLESYPAFFDHDKLEKILLNLLSNAAKFTPENGRVDLVVNFHLWPFNNGDDIFDGKDYIAIEVSDTGIGIPVEKQGRVFDHFFQVETSGSSNVNQGSGIGLSLVNEFVKLHEGTIHLDSKPGLGSTFTVRLPLPGHAAVNGANSQPAKSDIEAIFDNHPEMDYNNRDSDDKPLILIVEDNADLRFYLAENLKTQFVIIEAANGVNAWNLILSRMPRVVVSDVMMPLEDGVQLCRRIKNDPRTSHVPVILLTARASAEQTLEGYAAGAADYITKPFSFEILEIKIKRVLEARLSFQKTFNKKFEIKPSEINITSLDEKFLEKALKIVEKNMSNTEFSVDKMGKELGVSRGHLYNKLVALTGKSPVEFIRLMRLKRAAQYLAKSQQSVAEIAFMVGFNDPKYFSKYFKDEFGLVPSEFAKNPKVVD